MNWHLWDVVTGRLLPLVPCWLFWIVLVCESLIKYLNYLFLITCTLYIIYAHLSCTYNLHVCVCVYMCVQVNMLRSNCYLLVLFLWCAFIRSAEVLDFSPLIEALCWWSSFSSVTMTLRHWDWFVGFITTFQMLAQTAHSYCCWTYSVSLLIAVAIALLAKPEKVIEIEKHILKQKVLVLWRYCNISSTSTLT